MSIQPLSDLLINQIKAGEVVERPAAVVKELVENSLDAGADRIEVELDNGGIDRIRVTDTGRGIPQVDLALALSRHATSKITELEDLEAVASLGFRGEALASILSVSRLTLTSRTAESAHAWQIEDEGGGRLPDPRPAAHPVGTCIEVRDLFFNTPARRKFLRTPATELRAVQQALSRLALWRPSVRFSLRHNGRSLLALPAQTLSARVAALVGDAFVQDSLHLAEQQQDMALEGWIGLPSAARAQSDLQYVFVNGRHVRDRLVAGALRRAYADVMHSQHYPAFVLSLSLDPSRVDVNVHPQKTEVRFRDGHRVHDFLMGAVHQALRQARPEPARHHQVTVPELEPTISSSSSSSSSSSWRSGAARPLRLAEPGPDWRAVALALEPSSPGAPLSVREVDAAPDTLTPAPGVEHEGRPLGRALAQLHGIFILAENAEGLVVVDAHAAHERVLYERFKAELASGQLPSQALLVPEPVVLDEPMIELLMARQDELSTLGLEFDRSGPASLLVRRRPSLLAKEDLAALLRGLVNDEEALHVDGLRDAQQRLLANVACKAAIKANRRLSVPEMDALLRDMERTELAGQCNHGRRTWVQLTRPTLDGWFLRGR